MESVYYYALGSNLSFALAGQAFTYFSRQLGPVWMNTLKAVVACACFFLAAIISPQFGIIHLSGLLAFFISGAIGLAIGDIFLLSSFKEMGPGRTMLLFGFQPLIVGGLSFLFLGQSISSARLWAIAFFILCLVTISFESYSKSKSWQIKGILMAASGMLLDGIGIVLTRWSFNHNPEVGAMEANFYRTFGALVFFALYSRARPIHLLSKLKTLNRPLRILALVCPVLGTFLSLGLYLKAVQSANLAALSALSITGTVFSTFFECLIDQKWPGKYFYVAFAFFLVGMKFLIF